MLSAQGIQNIKTLILNEQRSILNSVSVDFDYLKVDS